MNKQIKYIVVFMFPVLFAGCEISFLDQVSLSDITSEFFYETEDDYEQALVGCYYYIAGRGTIKEGNFTYGVNIISQSGTDEVFANYTKTNAFYPQVHALDNYSNLVSSNYVCQEIWINHYQGISATNEILNRVWDMDIHKLDSFPRLREIAAEAAFLQALWYFNLVRIYGGVPLMEKPMSPSDDINAKGRNSIQEVYARIEQLLGYSKQYLPVNASKNGAAQYGRARRLSAYGLSAKVNLQIASSMKLFEQTLTDDIRLKTPSYPTGINTYNWLYEDVVSGSTLTSTETIKKYYEMARDDAEFVLSTYSNSHGGKYLNDNFTDSFYPSESTDEILFEAVLSSGFAQDMSGWFGSIYGPRGASAYGGGQHVLFTNNSVVMNTFTFRFKGASNAPDYVADGVQLDKRFAWTMATMQKNVNTTTITVANSFRQFELGKFRINKEDTPNQDRTPINNPILRVAETCLIYAEALAEINEINNPGSEVPAEALNFINVVRKRAGLNNFLYANQDGAGVCDYKTVVSYADIRVIGNKEIKGYTSTLAYAGGTPIGHFRRAIMNERILELVGEGHRWHDLVRMGMLIPVVEAVTAWSKVPGSTSVFDVDGLEIKNVNQANITVMPERIIRPFHVFRPIPNREIALHRGSLIQNSGY